jgi:ABC-type transporter Mla subunit MlaD
MKTSAMREVMTSLIRFITQYQKRDEEIAKILNQHAELINENIDRLKKLEGKSNE